MLLAGHNLSVLQCIQTGSGTHLVSLVSSGGGSGQGVKLVTNVECSDELLCGTCPIYIGRKRCCNPVTLFRVFRQPVYLLQF